MGSGSPRGLVRAVEGPTQGQAGVATGDTLATWVRSLSGVLEVLSLTR